MVENEKTTAVLNPRSTLEMAIAKGLDPATIGKMMDLQERWEAGKARKEYVEAMAGFKRECPAVIGKDKRADFGAGKAKYSYATTGAILTAITPALSKFGLSLSWETNQHERQVSVTCHVTHSGGHRESATLTGPHDESGGKNPIQTLGSSVHYLQRYTMVSVLGLATADMDDPDNNPRRAPVGMPVETPAAKAPPSSGSPGSKISEPQCRRLFSIAGKANVTEEDLRLHLKSHGLEHSADIPKALYDSICDWCERGGQSEPGDAKE